MQTASVIGILGPFDRNDIGAALVSRVLRMELARRIPDAEVRLFAPHGWERPSRLDGGEPAEPLGEWSHDRAADLADRLDLAVVAPVDRASDARDRWLEPGAFDGTGLAVEDVLDEPHVAILAGELLATSVIEKRLAFLRLMGWWPAEGQTRVSERGGGLQVGLVQLPEELSVEDVLAVIATADEVELHSPALAAVRRAYREDTTEERARIDLWFDGVVAAYHKATTGQAVERARAADRRIGELEARLAALEAAHDARGRRLVEERIVFADHVDALQRQFRVTRADVVAARADAERDHVRAELERTLRQRAEDLRAQVSMELALTRRTRSWRWTSPFRAALDRIRRRRP